MFDIFLVLNHSPVTAECKTKSLSTHTSTRQSILNSDRQRISQLRMCYEYIHVQYGDTEICSQWEDWMRGAESWREAVKASAQKPCVYEKSCNWVSLFMFNGWENIRTKEQWQEVDTLERRSGKKTINRTLTWWHAGDAYAHDTQWV